MTQRTRWVAVLMAAQMLAASTAWATDVPVTVEEQDGSPSVKQVKKVQVSNGTLTDGTGGTVIINTAGTPSQWTTGTGNVIYYNTANVGIGTTRVREQNWTSLAT